MIENKRLVAASRTAVGVRNYRRARSRALTRLAQAFPEQYKAYLKEEKQNDNTQGKAWIDLDGNTNSSMGASTRADTKASNRDTLRKTQAGDSREDEGDLE